MINWLLATVLIGGSIPRDMDATTRVSWLTADGTATGCSQPGVHDWVCEIDAAGEGIVVMSDESRVAYEHVDDRGQQGALHEARWGRLLVFSTAGPDDLTGLRVSAWKPERLPNHPRANRLRRLEAAAITTIEVGRSAAWIAGGDADPDGVVAIDGPAIASSRVAVAALMDGWPELAIFVPVSMPKALRGRAQDARGKDLAGVEVELFESLPGDATTGQAATFVSHAVARSNDSGEFSFDGLGEGPYLVVASDLVQGRGLATVQSVTEPLIIRLKPPALAVGRVLQHAIPAIGARVRFVPTTEAFRASLNPDDLGAGESESDAEGRFTLALPPQAAGVVLVTTSEGASARVPIPPLERSGAIALGDISLPDSRPLTVRVLDPGPCVLTAIGPLDGLGMAVVQSVSVGSEHWFELPEPGDWALDATCDGTRTPLQPTIVHVPDGSRFTRVDVRRGRTP